MAYVKILSIFFFRTAEFLFRHLNKVSKYGAKTGMHCKNLAIVWAPNLMRYVCVCACHVFTIKFIFERKSVSKLIK